MSAHLEVIDRYLERIVELAVKGTDDEALVEYMSRVHKSYESALRDVQWHHRERLRWRDIAEAIAFSDDRMSAGQLKDIARKGFKR